MPISLRVLYLLALTAFAGLAVPSRAAVPTTLPSIFGDHMVVQRGLPFRVWGRAEPGTAVAVTLAGTTRRAEADAAGAWSVSFDPLTAAADPLEITVTDAKGPVATYRDVLVGDVWVASGQSNMELALEETANAEAEVKQAQAPMIRLFQVRRTSAAEPQFTCEGRWTVCTPESAARFSGVAYYFAREVQKSQKVPIGMIGTYASGTKIEPWISLNGFLTEPLLREWGREIEERKANLGALQQQYVDEVLPAWRKRHDEWEREVAPSHRAAMARWNADAAAARANNTRLPPKPKPERPEPKKPDAPTINPRKLGGLFNAMVAPFVSFPIKGVIWYQGESNADNPPQYRKLFPGLIADWRRQWNQPGEPGSLTRDFPFLFVQLANFVSYPNADWPGLREAQAKTLQVKRNTAMAVAIDLGSDNDLHPKNKRDVGQRLALAAEHVAYGRQDVAFEGPTFRSMTTDGDHAQIVFDHVGDGLKIKGPADAPAAFMVAGPDGKFVPANAEIVGRNTVRLSSPHIASPKFVRYAWANTPHANLYDSAGLPAVPFRTDEFPTTAPAGDPKP